MPKNFQSAYIFGELAADGGAGWARAWRDEAAKELTPEQLEQAKAAVERHRAARDAARAQK